MEWVDGGACFGVCLGSDGRLAGRGLVTWAALKEKEKLKKKKKKKKKQNKHRKKKKRKRKAQLSSVRQLNL